MEKITEKISSKKSELSRILSIISIIICLIGGIAFIWFGVIYGNSIGEGYGSLLIVLGIFAVIGAIIELKYPRRGSIFCLAIGFIGFFVAWTLEYSAIYGTILTLIGSIVGFIGVMKE